MHEKRWKTFFSVFYGWFYLSSSYGEERLNSAFSWVVIMLWSINGQVYLRPCGMAVHPRAPIHCLYPCIGAPGRDSSQDSPVPARGGKEHQGWQARV